MHVVELPRLLCVSPHVQAECVKRGVESLTSEDIEAQLLLLTAVKDVALSLSDLIDSTRLASGKSMQDPAMEKLKSSAKVGGAYCSGCGFV